MVNYRKGPLVLLLLSVLHYTAVAECEWSNWANVSECDDPLLCRGNRTESRKCDLAEQLRIIPCEGKCKPCSAWSEWSEPCRQVRSREGTERRYRHCFFFLQKKQREFMYRPADCEGCPWCGHGAGYDCTLH